MMGIVEFLDAPDSAVLIAIDGDVNLVMTRHETPTRTIIDRFQLGPVANIDAVLALLGIVDRLPATSAPTPAQLPDVQRPALPAADGERRHTCSDCGAQFWYKTGLLSHRRAKHGEPPKVRPVRVVLPDATEVACDLCDRIFKNQHALDVHKARSHRGSTRSTRPKAAAVTPAVAALVTQPAPGEAAPVSLDVVSSPAPPVAPTPTPAVLAGGVCPTCHEPLVSHEECDECNVLIGIGHETQRATFVTGLNLCRDCARLRLNARKAEARSAHAS